jgi:hypothetical protein
VKPLVLQERGFFSKPGPLVDLALTLPVFLVYHLGVVFLHLRNGVDLLTGPLMNVADGDRVTYLLLTGGIGAAFALVFALLGRGRAFRLSKFIQIAVEGIVFAVVLRLGASYVVGNLFAGNVRDEGGALGGIVQSCGAGFYEELIFRVILFGLGANVLVWLFARERIGVLVTAPARLSLRAAGIMAVWCLVVSAVFSGMHYIGSVGDAFQLTSFTFRLVLGVLLTLIYVTRGFAAAVWAHMLYDVWVIVLK